MLHGAIFTLLYDDLARMPMHWKHSIKYVAANNRHVAISIKHVSDTLDAFSCLTVSITMSTHHLRNTALKLTQNIHKTIRLCHKSRNNFSHD